MVRDPKPPALMEEGMRGSGLLVGSPWVCKFFAEELEPEPSPSGSRSPDRVLARFRKLDVVVAWSIPRGYFC